MTVREIKPGIFSVGAIDWDRRLFDELIPLPDGTSYNAYIVKGRTKTALIDTVDPTKTQELVDNLAELEEKLKAQEGLGTIDYVIANHAEQDHAGAIPRILELFPQAKVATNAKCQAMLMDLLHVPAEKFLGVADGQTLDLGGRSLKFITFPWVHWPETMLTYLPEDKILFPCDFFGSHLAVSDLYVQDECQAYRSAKRYYAEIMMPFRTNIANQWGKVKDLPLEMIAPSHGPIHQKPKFIMDAYLDWTSDKVKNEVVIAYVSMHGSTQTMVDHLVEALIERGIEVKPFNLTRTDIGELAMALVDAATVIIATPTVLAGPHPAALYAAALAGALRPKTKFAGIIGSYGWGGKAVEILAGLLAGLKVELLDPVLLKGLPRAADFASLDRLADNVTAKHSNLDPAKK